MQKFVNFFSCGLICISFSLISSQKEYPTKRNNFIERKTYSIGIKDNATPRLPSIKQYSHTNIGSHSTVRNTPSNASKKKTK